MRRSHVSPVALGLLLAVLTLCTFSPLLQAGFIDFDDQVYVTDNARVKAGLTPSNVEWAFTNLDFGFYYPLTWLSHMTDCQLFGLNASGHHLTSILIHVANALLLFLFLLKATGAKWKSWLVSALFALHPLHVESVAWIAERKDVLSTFFLFLSLLAYLHYSRKPTITRYLAVFLLLALGLMAKSMIVTAPLVFLLLDFWPLGRSTWLPWERISLANATDATIENRPGYKSPLFLPKFSPKLLVLEKIPILLLSIIFSIITLMGQSNLKAVASTNLIPISTRFGNAAVSYATYIQKMFIPINLTILYTFPNNGWGWPVWKVILSSLLLVLITALIFKLARGRPFLIVGWLWYLIVAFPVCGLFQTGQQAFADRYTYVSLIGVFILLVWSLSARVGWSTVALIIVLAILSWNQSRYWRSTVTVFSHSLVVNGASVKILHWLGYGLINEGHSPLAKPYLEMGTRIYPNDSRMWRLLGLAHFLSGDTEPAEICVRHSIELVPTKGKSYEILGMILERKGEWSEALRSYLKAIHYMNNDGPLRLDAGRMYGRMRQYEKALVQFRKAASIAPHNPVPVFYTALALEKLGRMEEARATLKRSLEIAQSNGNSGFIKKIEFYLKAAGYQETTKDKPGNRSGKSNRKSGER